MRYHFLSFIVAVLGCCASARTITIDTGENFHDLPTFTEIDGDPLSPFADQVVSIDRLADGTVQLVIEGDLVLEATDVLKGEGLYPVVLQVGNDVNIAATATIDFSAVGMTPGPGGGSGAAGSEGGQGGAGGKGGFGGLPGLFGTGGVKVDGGPLTLGFALTSYGQPATGGFRGWSGRIGGAGEAGGAGVPGQIGYGWRGFGAPGGQSSIPRTPPQSESSTGGDGGASPPFPPAIYIEGDEIRGLLYNGDGTIDGSDRSQFLEYYYNGKPGGEGIGRDPSAVPNSPFAADPDSHGDGGELTAPEWLLVGGTSGGSGAGGSGGAGGAGGGGGGGGAGGLGEWIQPFPSTWSGLLTEIISELAQTEPAQKLKAAVLKRLFKQAKQEAKPTKALPLPEIGATGGLGGFGGRGGDGGNGGVGGDGGSSGAGGGAIRIVAQGKIDFNGTAEVRGGPGSSGSGAGEASLGLFRFLGTGPGPRLPRVEVGAIVTAALDAIRGEEQDSINSGTGGLGGPGGYGFHGDPGDAGGDGGGGSGGTIILEGSLVRGAGTLDMRGGSATNPGGEGRVFVGSNSDPATDTISYLSSFSLLPSDIDLGSTTRAGTTASNPFIAGSPDVPTLPGLVGGAEAFGDLGFSNDAPELFVLADDVMVSDPKIPIEFPLADSTEGTVSLLTATGMASAVAVLRTDRPPSVFADFPGYDYVFVINTRSTPLTEVHFGCNVQPIDDAGLPVPDVETEKLSPVHTVYRREGGWQNDTLFGGSGDVIDDTLGEGEIFVFLVPEDVPAPPGTEDGLGLNFYLSVSDLSDPGNPQTYVIDEDRLLNGELVTADFDPGAASVRSSDWAGGSNGDWNVAANWNTTDPDLGSIVGSGQVPDNTTTLAYNVTINLDGSTTNITQDEKVIIDRFEIGSGSTISLVNNATLPGTTTSLTIEKFDVRPDAGLIANDGTIHLGAATEQTSLRFSGTDLTLTGSGEITTTSNAQNVIAGVRSGDSLLQEFGHEIIASGSLGQNSLIMINEGLITTNTAATAGAVVPLVIDPSGNATRSTPAFINRDGLGAGFGTLQPSTGHSELVLTDGHFLIEDGSFFGFTTNTPPAEQQITLNGVRLRHEHATYLDSTQSASPALLVDGSERTLQILEETTLVDTNLRNLNEGRIEIGDNFSNTDLTLLHSALMVSEGSTSSVVLTNASLSSGLLTYNASELSNNALTCASDQLDPDFDAQSFDPASFLIGLDGSLNRLGDLRIDGSFCYNPLIDQLKIVQDTASSAIYADGYYAFPANLLTLQLQSGSHLAISGTLDHNGMIDAGTQSSSEVLVDGQVELVGEGGWKMGAGRIRGITPSDDASILPNEIDRLVVGADQVFFNPAFETTELVVENHGTLLGTVLDYDASTFSDPADSGYQTAIKRVILTNRGVIQPSYGHNASGTSQEPFGGGTIDNEGGIIDLGGSAADPRQFVFDDVRVVGGEITIGTFWGEAATDAYWGNPQAGDPEEDILDAIREGLSTGGSDNGGARDTQFIDVTFSCPLKPALTLAEFLTLLPGDGFLPTPNSLGYTALGPAPPLSGIIALGSGSGVILNNTTLDAHCAFGLIAVERSLTIADNVIVSFERLDVSSDDYEINFGTGSQLILGPFGGTSLTGTNSSTFTVPSGLELRALGNLGDNLVTIINEGTIASAAGTDFSDGPIIFDPNGAAPTGPSETGNIGLTNHGLITGTGTLPGGLGSALQFESGTYDNTAGVIEFAPDADITASNQINDALIIGGTLRGSGEGATVTLNNSTLRGVKLENLQLLGTYTIDETDLVNDDGTANTFPGGTVTLTGGTTLSRDPSAAPLPVGEFDFIFDGTVNVGDSPSDQLIFAEGVSVSVTGAGSNLRSFTNYGSLTLEGGGISLVGGYTDDANPLTGDVMVFDPTTNQLVTLSSLGVTSLDAETASIIRNAGTIVSLDPLTFDGVRFDNTDGTVSASELYLYDSFVENTDGILESDSNSDGLIYSRNSFINGGMLLGTLKVTSVLDSNTDDDEALTTVSDVIIDGGLTFEGDVNFTTDPALLILGDCTYGSDIDYDTGEMIVSGSLISNNGSTIYPSESGSLKLAGGSVDRVDFAAGNGGGTLEGSGEITGELILDPSSTLRFGIAGTEPGVGYDQIEVTGLDTDAPGVSIQLILDDDFTPWSGDRFTVFVADAPLPADFLGLSSGSTIQVFRNGGPAGTFELEYGPGSSDPNSIVVGNFEPDATLPAPTDGTRKAWTGGLNVTWINGSNTSSSISGTLTAATSPGLSFDGASSNNGDYFINFPAVSSASTEGAFIATMAQAFGSNGSGPTSTGTAGVQESGSRFFIATHRTAAGGGPEYDYNTSFGWFPYDQWLGGLASNFPTNGSPINRFESGGRLTHGTSGNPNLLERGGGKFTLDLRSADPDATPENGVLLVCGAKNEDNFAQSQDLGDGTFGIYVRDNGEPGTNIEQDPVTFVYIPFDAVADTELVAAGRIYDVGNIPQTDQSTQNFTITKGTANGTWFLSIPGHDPSTGTLLISAEGTEASSRSADNVVTHQWDAPTSSWVIQSWDIPQPFPSSYVNNPLVVQSGADGEDMFSFAFFATDPDPVPPPVFETYFPGLDPTADDNGNGRSNFEDYAAGYDPTAPTDLGLQPGIHRSSGGQLTLDHPVAIEGEDFVVRWERTSNLTDYFSMTEGEDYRITNTVPLGPERNQVTIEILFGPGQFPKQFFRPRYLRKAVLSSP